LTATIESRQAEAIAFDPRTVTEARRQADWPKWQEAMNEELRRLQSRNTWTIVKPPQNTNIIDCKWVFRTKRDAKNNITGYRARLVARGFTQVEGADYFADDTFATVARLQTVRAILAMARRLTLKIHQIDVVSAYLYGLLDKGEDIYMKPPPNVTIPGLDNRQVLKLLVAIYGLKQVEHY